MLTTPTVKRVIDLAEPFKPLISGYTPVGPRVSGVVELEKRDGHIFYQGRRGQLFRSDEQKAGLVSLGYGILNRIDERVGKMHAKALDCFVEHPEMWPEEWKVENERGFLPTIHFPEPLFKCGQSGIMFVRTGRWFRDSVTPGFAMVLDHWHNTDPIAVHEISS